MTDTYTARLEALEDKREDAEFRAAQAREAGLRSRDSLVHDVTADLAGFHNANDFHQPDATPPEERAARETELSNATLDLIREKGLTVKPVPANGRVALLIHDPHVDEEWKAAQAEVGMIVGQIKSFKTAHAADLETERSKADADRIRETLAGDNGDAIRDLIAGRDGSAVFTTRDLPQHGGHKRSRVLTR
jgi:hypothetical protein